MTTCIAQLRLSNRGVWMVFYPRVHFAEGGYETVSEGALGDSAAVVGELDGYGAVWYGVDEGIGG